ncbi:MAG: autotransporter-associated beta strand repeat-containing protein [Pirellulales bacterium]
MNVSGINFLPVNASFGNNALGYAIGGNSGTLAFDANSVINLSDNISGANVYVHLNPAAITGDSLTFQKAASTTTAQRIRISGNNTGLTGTLTAKGANGGVALQLTTNSAVQAVTKIVAESGATVQLINDNEIFTRNLEITGAGLGSAGALLFTGNNITQSGNILLNGASTIGRGTARVTAAISGVISESAANTNLTFYERGNLILTNQSTYTGSTANRINTVIDSTLTLEFSTLGGGANNILYSGTGVGDFRFEHTAQTGLIQNALVLQGAATGTNSQRLGNIIVGESTVAAVRTSAQITLLSGAANTLNLTVGGFTKATLGSSLRITDPNSGTITANNNSSTNGLIGPFVVYSNTAGTVGGWAGVTGNVGSGGTLGVFQGDVVHTAGTPLNTYGASANLAFTNFTSGNVAQAAANTLVNTLTMRATNNAHTVVVGSGNTLRLSELGGIQILAGATDLTIGTEGNAGTLTIGNAGVNVAGGAPFAATDLFLTNMSSVGTLTINSVIANNGVNATNDIVHLVANGSGKVVLAGVNTFTGNFTLHSGYVELRNSSALGTSAGTNYIYEGAQLQLSGGITIADALNADGSGDGTGAIRNLSGNNTLAGLITGYNTKQLRFYADAGSTLNLNNAGGADANIISGTNPGLIFDGAGTIVVANRISINNGPLTKEGTGTLVLNGNNIIGGVITVNAGVLRVGHANALYTLADGGAITVNDGGTLEFVDGISMANGVVTLNGAGADGKGALRLASGSVNYAGSIIIGTNATRIGVDAGATLTLSNATNALRPPNGGGRSVVLGIDGTLIVTGVIAVANNRVLTVVKEGAGTAYYRNSMTYTGSTTVSNGALQLDFANASPTSNLILAGNNVTLSGGTLQLAGKAATTNSQTLTTLTADAASRSNIELTAGDGGTVTLNLGSLKRDWAAVLDFNIGSGGGVNTTNPNLNGILGGAYTFGKSTWAVSNATTQSINYDLTTDAFTGVKSDGDQVSFTGTTPTGVNAFQTYYVVSSTGTTFKIATTLGGTPVDLTTSGTTTLVNPGSISGLSTFSASNANNDFVVDANIDVVGSSNQVTKAVNSIRFNTPGASTVMLTGTGTQIITLPSYTAGTGTGGGGILVTSAVGANTVGFAGTGQVRAGTGNNLGDLIIHQHNTAGVLNFGTSVILVVANNGRITKTGAGDVVQQGLANSNNTQLTILEGRYILQGNNRINAANLPNLNLGSGSSSGKLVLQALSATDGQTFDGIAVSGSGTGNAIVGGGSDNYTLRLNNASTSPFDLTQLKLGGSLTNENNLGLTVMGGTTVTLGANNTFSGNIRVEQGRLVATSVADPSSANSFGTGTSSIMFGDFNLTNLVVGFEYTGSGAGATSRALELANNQTPGLIDLTLELVNNGLGSIALTSNIANTGSNLTDVRIIRLSGTSTAANSIAGVDALNMATTNLEKTGIGRWLITGTSFHNGVTNIVDGTLQLGNGGTGGSLAASSYVNLGTTGSRLRTSRSNTLVIAQQITGGGGVEIANTATGRTIVTHVGNNYVGPTTVSSGTLTVDGAIAGSGVTVGPGNSAALNGSGIIHSNVHIAAGATFSAGSSAAGQAGNGVGQITLAAGLSLDAGAAFVFDFSANSSASGGAGTDWDFIHLTGGMLRLSGDKFTIYIDSWNESLGYGQNGNATSTENFDPTGTYQWHWLTIDGAGQRIVDADGNALADGTLSAFQFVTDRTGTGVFAAGSGYAPVGGSFWLSKSGNDLYVNYAAVPEPSSLALMSIATAAFGYRRRRKVRQLLTAALARFSSP